MNRTLLLSGLAVSALALAWGQKAPSKDTPSKGGASGEDLAKENRELKAYADELEKRLGELHQGDVKPQDSKPQAPPRLFVPPAPTFPLPIVPAVPMPPTTRPFRFDYTNPWPGGGNPFAQPHQYQVRPYIQVTPPSTQPAIPPGSRKYRFNGADVYVIPL